jgi:endoglucanase
MGTYLYLKVLFLVSLTTSLFSSHVGVTSTQATCTDKTEGIQNKVFVKTNPSSESKLVLNSIPSGKRSYCSNQNCSSGTECSESLSYESIQYTSLGSGGWYSLGYDIYLTTSEVDLYIGSLGLLLSEGKDPIITSSTKGTASIGTKHTASSSYPIYFSPDHPNISTIVGIYNDTENYFSFSSSSQDSLSSCFSENANTSCSSTLAPGSTQYISLSSNGYINLSYNTCAVNENPCSTCFTLGSFKVEFTTDPTDLSVVSESNGTTVIGIPTDGVYPITFVSADPPCPLGSIIPTPQAYSTLPFRGFNLAGCDFETFTPPCACDAVYFTKQGASIIRLPVLWEYLQPDINVPIDFSTGDALVYADLVRELTASGLYVVIDLHNYMRYNPSDPGADIDGDDYIVGNNSPTAINGPTAEQYGETWETIATEFVHNPLVLFDLMNEPNHMSTTLILSNYNTVMPYIRNVESIAGVDPHIILLEGGAYSCMGLWTTAYPSQGYPIANSEVFTPANINDPGNNYIIHVHEYFSGLDGNLTTPCGSGSTECVNSDLVLSIENFPEFVSYLQTYSLKAYLGELNGIADNNCAACINNLLSALETVPYSPSSGYGFIGWSGWAGGSFDTSYSLNLTPTYIGAKEVQTIQMIEGFNPHMTPLEAN